MWQQGWASHDCLPVLGGRSSRAAPDFCPSGPSGAVSGLIPAPALALPILLSAAGATDPVVGQLGPQPTPGTGSCQKPGCVLRVFLYFPFQGTKIHLRGALFCPCLCSTCSDRFFEGTSVLRDTEGHSRSSKQCSRHHPPFFRHIITFSHPIEPRPRLSGVLGQTPAGAGACAPARSPALPARHGDRPQTWQQHQGRPRHSGTGIGRGHCLEWGGHISVSPSAPRPGGAVDCRGKDAYKGRGEKRSIQEQPGVPGAQRGWPWDGVCPQP